MTQTATTPTNKVTKESLHDWLMSEHPASRRQAALGHAYNGWRTFAINRLAMLGHWPIAKAPVTATVISALVWHRRPRA